MTLPIARELQKLQAHAEAFLDCGNQVGILGRMRILHTMLRVTDLSRSLEFYTKGLGLIVRSHKDFPDGRLSIAFVGSPNTTDLAELELVQRWDGPTISHGDGYGNVGLLVDDVEAVCERVKGLHGKVLRAPGPKKHGTKVIAIVEDPDGYKIELVNESRPKTLPPPPHDEP